MGNSEIANSLGQQSRRESPGCSHHFREYLMDWLTSTGFFLFACLIKQILKDCCSPCLCPYMGPSRAATAETRLGLFF